MSRFELYGGNHCHKCSNYVAGKDDSCQTPRCTIESNTYTNWLGLMYKQRPESINWNLRCENYKEKENG